MKCFYHRSDLDGHCSGAIVKRRYPECEMIGVEYNDPFFINTFEENEKVFIVDFSYPMDIMEKINSQTELHWIDHHKSAIGKAHEVGFIASGGQSLDTEYAACELVWDYLFLNKKIPTSVKFLGRYDIWDHVDPRVLPFQMAVRSNRNTLPDSLIWSTLFTAGSEYISNLILQGDAILRYVEKENKTYATGMSFEAEFEGLRAIVINKAYSNSKIFDSIYDPDKHDIMILFGIKPGEYKYSLYSDKYAIDVSKIAMKYGGGGHKGAAGFHFNELLF